MDAEEEELLPLQHRVSVKLCLHFVTARTEFPNCWHHRYMRLLEEAPLSPRFTGYRLKMRTYDGSFTDDGWVRMHFHAIALRPREHSVATFRRQVRAALQAVQVATIVRANEPNRTDLAFSHMNAFMDGRCIVSCLSHVHEDMRAEWVRARVERAVEKLRAEVCNVDADLEREDQETDDESTAAERMRHGRILGSGHLCTAGAGGSEPVAEREPARDGPECAPAASASISAEATA